MADARGTSADDTRDGLCESLEADMTEYSSADFSMLARTLKACHVTGREYVDEDLEEADAFEKLKQQYSFYNCKVKSELDDNHARKRIVRTLFNVGVFVLSCVITVYMLNQIRYAFTMRETNVTVIYALITIILFNPFASLITISFELTKFNASNKVPQSRVTQIETLEKLLKNAVSCRDNFDSNIRSFVINYDKSDIAEDLPVKRMEKLTQINRVVTNLKEFVERSSNASLSTKQREVILKCVKFLRGKHPKMLDAILSSETSKEELEERYFFKTSEQVRKRAGAILQYHDDTVDPKTIGEYNTYFVVELEGLLSRLVIDVEKHAKHLELDKLGGSNILFCDDIDTRESLAAADRESEIIAGFESLSMRVRRLRTLRLPEYEHLMKALNPDDNAEWKRLLLQFDKATVGKSDVLTVMELFLNNTVYFFEYPSTRDGVCRLSTKHVRKEINGTTYEVTLPVMECEQDANTDMCMRARPNFDLRRDVYEKADPDYLKANSLVYARALSLLRSLPSVPLPTEYRKALRIEVDLIFAVLEGQLEAFDWTVDGFISISQEGSSESVFLDNLREILGGVKLAQQERVLRNPLTLDRSKAIQDPRKYIPFDVFDEKLNGMVLADYKKFHTTLVQTQSNVQFFNDRLNELDDSAELQVHQSSIYVKYIYLYWAVSFLILVDFGWKYYTGKTVDVSIMSKLQKKQLNNESKESAEFNGV